MSEKKRTCGYCDGDGWNPNEDMELCYCCDGEGFIIEEEVEAEITVAETPSNYGVALEALAKTQGGKFIDLLGEDAQTSDPTRTK